MAKAVALREKFLAVEKEMNSILIERAPAIRGVMLATLSSTNVLLLGSAGIAKSMLIEEWNRRITGASYFGWLLTKFSTPEELFGPISLKGLEEERYYRVTRGKLPEASTVFLDEIFKGNGAILNAMLSVLNERKFYNDGIAVPLKLITIAGASNEIPDSDDGLDAFFDRFLLKFKLSPINESGHFITMLRNEAVQPTAFVSLSDIEEAHRQIAKVGLNDGVLEQILRIREKVRKDVTSVSDRTFKKSLGILQAQAWLEGYDEIQSDHLELFRHIAWTKPEQEKSIHSAILELISPEKQKIVEIFSQITDKVQEVYKQQEAQKRNTAVVETATKIREARIQIANFKRQMLAKKQDVREVEAMEEKLDRMNLDMAKDILGVDLRKERVV